MNAPDEVGRLIPIYHCRTCCALTPDYGASRPGVSEVDFQATYHEAMWRSETDAALRKHAKSMHAVAEFYRHHLPDPDSDQVVFDIGAGRGNLTAALVDLGLRVFSCEPSKELVERARRVLGLTDEVLMLGTADAFLDLHEAKAGQIKAVFLWHVLEHIENPMQLLQRLAGMLAPDGVLICQGPLLDGEHVFPAHRFLHSESNITWLAQAAGLKVLMIESNNPERYVSFVLAHPEHPDEPIDTVFFTDPMEAAGSLFFTLSQTVRILDQRISLEMKEP